MISSIPFSKSNEDDYGSGDEGGEWFLTLFPIHIIIPQYNISTLSYSKYSPWRLNTWIPKHIDFIKEEKEENKHGPPKITIKYKEMDSNSSPVEMTVDEVQNFIVEFRTFFSKREIELPVEIQASIHCLRVIENSFSSSNTKEDILDTSTFPLSLQEDLARIELMNQSFLLSPVVILSKMQTLVMSSTNFSTSWEIWFRLFQLAWYHLESPFVSSSPSLPHHSMMYFQISLSLFTNHTKNRHSIGLPEWSLWYEKFLHLYYISKGIIDEYIIDQGQDIIDQYIIDQYIIDQGQGIIDQGQGIKYMSKMRGMDIIEYIQNHSTLFESLPSQVRNSILTNMLYYIPSLTDSYSIILFMPLVPKIPLSVSSSKKGFYSLLNPSMARDDRGRILVNTRYCNYDVNTYQSFETDGCIHTHNYLFFIEEEEDGFHRKEDGYWLSPEYPRYEHAKICGLEDVRLFWFCDQWWFTANCCDFKNHSQQPCVVIGKLNSSPDSGSKRWNTEFVCRLSFPLHESACEKNWIPLVLGDQLFFIYSLSPFIMYQFPDICPQLFDCVIVCDVVMEKQWNSSLFHASFRGCGPFIPIPQSNGTEFITISREVIWMNKKRHYLHRWFHLRIGDDLSIQLCCSNLFTLGNRDSNIQYSLGLCPSTRFPERYYLSVSIMDENAGFFMIPSLKSIVQESQKNSLF